MDGYRMLGFLLFSLGKSCNLFNPVFVQLFTLANIATSGSGKTFTRINLVIQAIVKIKSANSKCGQIPLKKSR